jgi:Dipeptidyl aminopeptidases/acylaminoacyl-peptidases
MLAAMMAYAGPALAAPPLEAYGRLPNLDHVEISPDGANIAYVRNGENKRVIVIQALGDKSPPIILDCDNKKLRGLGWVSPTHLFFSFSTTGVALGADGDRQENATGQYYDLKTHTLHPLLDHPKGLNYTQATMNVIAGVSRGTYNGRPVAYVTGVSFLNNRGRYALFRVDLETGESRLVSREDRLEAEGWLLDENGKIIAEESTTEYTQHWKLSLYHDGLPDKPLMDVPSPIEGPSMEGLTEDGSAVIVEMPETVEGKIYKQVSLKDGTISPWRPDLAEAGDLFFDDKTSRVMGVSHSVDKTDYVFFDPKLETLWQSAKAAFASATNVSLASWTDDRTKVVLEVFGPKIGNGYFLLDLAAKKAFPVGAAYDGINEFYEEKWISYKAADGRSINAYLTLPNREAKNLPLVVLPHGGPHARDFPGFDFLSQSLASRGYVVLQPEFRGSGGFGRELLEAGFHEYGKKMQTDLSDGMRALAAQGLIDPKRVCIFGASYGGYAALAGPTLDPGVYRCAVSLAGPSDMREMLKGWPKPSMGANGARFWDRFVGIEDGNLAKADAVSPAKFADKVTIPVMLIHGKDDTVVPYEQSEIMASALKSAGKKYEFVTLEGEDHWLSTGKTRLQMLEAAVKFIEANNPPN